ncbi:MAG TPA: hypothetical protein VKU19_33790 [Bryobacteraceae bacterium]|nr:hypothetical protein [Bryobacteraceae bacterium]
MPASAMLLAVARFACWEAALFWAALKLAGKWSTPISAPQYWLTALAIQVTLESSIAAAFSYAHWNSQAAYWIAAAVCVVATWGMPLRLPIWAKGRNFPAALIAALTVPLALLSFKPVEEIDSINYLHFLIEWLSNRASPYTFATNYVAFWELSFAPVWMVTRVDLFFPLLALKAVVLMALALWLVGRHLLISPNLLRWAIFGAVVMQHYWYGPSGVPTLKNDVLHGVGFVLLALVILRAVEGPLATFDLAILAFGIAFSTVKYTGIFEDGAAIAIVCVLRGREVLRHWKAAILILAFFLLTSGHYYLHNLLLYGSPFYPFQINLAFLHLPGTADLSNTSILYSLHDPRLWRALFLPAGGISPAGFLFPLVLAATLLIASARCGWAALSWLRTSARPAALDWLSLFLLAGWFLYFRSVFSASAYSGDLAFILNGLNTIRYVDGVLAVSELLLVTMIGRWAWLAFPLVLVNLASRLYLLYGHLNLFPPLVVAGFAILALAVVYAFGRHAVAAAVACLVAISPLLVERNRTRWTVDWNDLKPEIRAVAGRNLAELALPDGGYFAGHLVAVGSPMNPAVRSLLPEEMDALPAESRPLHLVVLVTPGSEVAHSWEERYGPKIAGWGYRKTVPGQMGALFDRVNSPDDRPARP